MFLDRFFILKSDFSDVLSRKCFCDEKKNLFEAKNNHFPILTMIQDKLIFIF